jgi:CRP/FNR family cyclic AMP-dependent transcriptional regulator
MASSSHIVRLVMPDHLGESKLFDEGVVLIRQGHHDHVLYILEWGALEVLKDDVQLALISQPGSIFGDLSALLEIAHTATVRTVERSCLRVIPQAHIAFRSSPRLTLFIAQQLARRFIGLDNSHPETRPLI